MSDFSLDCNDIVPNDECLLSQLKTIQVRMNAMCTEKGLPLPPVHLFQIEAATELTRWLQRHHDHIWVSEQKSKAPPGNWYMLSLNPPNATTRAQVEKIHQEFLDYMNSHKKGIVVHSVLEKASQWHTHSIVNLYDSKTNLERDLSKFLMFRVHIGKKNNSLKDYNALCKYVLKREYPEKGETAVATLIDGIAYVKGKGYQKITN